MEEMILKENIVEMPWEVVNTNICNWEDAFGNKNPIKLEIGPGRGEFLIQCAQEEPDVNFVGIEIRYKRVQRINLRLVKLGLKNVKLIAGDARDLLEDRFAQNSIDTVFMHFPDPWPKVRHEKRRLLSEACFNKIHRVLLPGGKFYFTTDVPLYGEQMQDIAAKHNGYRLVYSRVGDCASPYHNTVHETKFKALGRTIFYFCFEKI